MDLAERMKKVLDHVGGKQEAFALETGIQIDRLRSILMGRIKKLRDAELDAIEGVYAVRRVWMEHHRGPMLLTAQEKKAQPLWRILKRSNEIADSLKLDSETAQLVSEIMFHVEARNRDGLRNTLARISASAEPIGAASLARFVVPMLPETAAAGLGRNLTDGSCFVEVMAFESSWLERRLGLRQGECALVELQGDSMSPTLLDGDVVLIDTRSQVVEDNGVFVFAQRSKLRVKRIQRRMNGALKIISDNPAYEAEELTPQESDDFRVIGRVVWPRLR
jgi:phage repressor protein C with HTH and peptisase S24 domain